MTTPPTETFSVPPALFDELAEFSLGFEEIELEDSAGFEEALALGFELDGSLEELLGEAELPDGFEDVVCDAASLGFVLLELSGVL